MRSMPAFLPSLPVLAALLVPAGPSAAALTWRVDFNGASASTVVLSNFSGWAVSSLNRTQSFENVDGGGVLRSLSVRFTGGGATWSAFERSMNGGVVTNLYRDGVQCTAPLALSLAGLASGGRYALRIWYYDDDFSIGTVQSYTRTTDGASLSLGTLTNTTVANLAAGQAGLPNSLYDDRYCLSLEESAGAGGTIDMTIAASVGNAKLNALELVEESTNSPSLSWSALQFAESPANDGTIAESVTASLAMTTFAGTNGEDLAASGLVMATGVPPGLQLTAMRIDAEHLVLAFQGVASAHAGVDSTTNLVMALLDGAFAGTQAAAVTDSTKVLSVRFSDPEPTNGPYLAWSSVPDARYRVEMSTNLSSGWSVLRSNLVARPALNQQYLGVVTSSRVFVRIIQE